MSQSNDSPAPCADKGEHGKSTTSVCDTLCSEARGQKKRNLVTVTIVAPPTGKRKRDSWVWKVMEQFESPNRKFSVRCSVEVSKYGKWSRAVPCLHGVVQREHQHSQAT